MACSGFRRSSRDSSRRRVAHWTHALARGADGDYCAPRRGASGGILFERSGLHLAGQLPAVDNVRGGSASGEFILPAVPDAARTAVVDRRQLTGKMKSTALEKNTTGSASPRRTIVPSLATASSVILVLKETGSGESRRLVGMGLSPDLGLELAASSFGSRRASRIVRFLVADFSLGIGGKSHYLRAKTELLWGA